MKKKFFLSTLVLLLGLSQAFAAQVYSIEEAIKRNLVTVSITGISNKENTQSSHYGACIAVKITNRTAQNFGVKFETGRLLDCHDTSVQTMLITKSNLVNLEKHKTHNTRLYAMCSQKNKAAPGEMKKFALGSMAKESLVGIAKIIEKKNYQNAKAQDAVWAITDNKPIDHLKEGNEIEKELYNYVREVKIKEANLHAKQSAKIGFTTNFNNAGSVSIKVFDSNGKIVKSLQKTTTVNAGENNFEFWVYDSEYGKGKYKVVLFFNGVAKMEQEFEF